MSDKARWPMQSVTLQRVHEDDDPGAGAGGWVVGFARDRAGRVGMYDPDYSGSYFRGGQEALLFANRLADMLCVRLVIFAYLKGGRAEWDYGSHMIRIWDDEGREVDVASFGYDLDLTSVDGAERVMDRLMAEYTFEPEASANATAPECGCGHPLSDHPDGEACMGTLGSVSDADWVMVTVQDEGADPSEPCVCTLYDPAD